MVATFETYTDKNGQWRWTLRHQNGNIIADSGQGYSTKDAMVVGINSVKENAPTAAIKEVKKATV